MKGSEVLKYNPANITPDHLFCPPTSTVHPELTYLVGQLDKVLEGSGVYKGDRILRVGTEFEILFFSTKIDPGRADDDDIFYRSSRNPNYASEHRDKMYQMLDFAKKLNRYFPDQFDECDRMSKIFFEFRTAPQPVSDHLATVERLGDLLRDKCRKMEVLPVVFSQHIHVSLRNSLDKVKHQRRQNCKDGFIPDPLERRDLLNDTLPLVLLPEEWSERFDNVSHLVKSNGKLGERPDCSLLHPEFRKLSSEYAHDPLLNLVLSLRAMEEFCFHRSPRGKYSENLEGVTYELAIEKMRKDKALAKFFGRSTLDTLSNIAAQYPAVSRREITIDQVK